MRKIASFIRRQHIKKFFLTGAKGVPIFNELVAALAQSVEQRTENPETPEIGGFCNSLPSRVFAEMAKG